MPPAIPTQPDAADDASEAVGPADKAVMATNLADFLDGDTEPPGGGANRT